MYMANLMIDTDILIDHLRGLQQAHRFLRERRESGDLLYVSVITHAELLAGARPSEEQMLQELLESLQTVMIDKAVAEQGGVPSCDQAEKISARKMRNPGSTSDVSVSFFL